MVALNIETQRKLFALGGEFAPDVKSDAERRASEGGVWIAAQCMYFLNRTARVVTNPEKERIYALKRRLIQRLYELGFCIACVPEKQIIKCWTCGGKGTLRHIGRIVGDCEDCGGTGDYKVVKLYSFAFDVQGRVYVWHQPEDQVTFEPILTSAEEREFESWKAPINEVRLDYVPLYAAIVEAWLAHEMSSVQK